jgi:hypothetical protein
MKAYKIYIFSGGEKTLVVEGEFYDLLPQKSETGLQLVRRNPKSNFNQYSRLAFIESCEPYHIVLAPVKPFDDNNDTFAVLDRHRKYTEV